MTPSRAHILDQLASGEITADEAARRLRQPNPPSGERPADNLPAAAGRRLRVRVVNLDTGRDRVNVHVPIALVEAGLRLGARYEPRIAALDVDEIFDQIRAGAGGKIVEVEDWEDGERVEIFIE
jgi:hypothetical protein